MGVLCREESESCSVRQVVYSGFAYLVGRVLVVLGDAEMHVFAHFALRWGQVSEHQL
jgi:hypothetical protein